MEHRDIPPETVHPEAGASRALPAIASLAAVCLVGALVSSSEPVGTILIAAGALCGAAVFVEALRRGRALAARSAQIAELRHTLARQETEVTRLSAVVLPEAIERLRRGEVAEEVLTSLGGRAGHGNRWGNDAALTPASGPASRPYWPTSSTPSTTRRACATRRSGPS
ncbi:hypothetical protein ACU4GG_40165 [Streptomyces nojiriensis]